MTTRTPEEEANYWKMHARRHEDRAKRHHTALVRALTTLEDLLDSISDALEPADKPRGTKTIVFRP